MLFNSLTFWVFFPIFLGIYFITKGRLRLLACLSGSYLFYGWWDWRFLALIGLLTVVNFWCGLNIDDPNKDQPKKRLYLYLSIIFSLSVLGFFKYFNFFIDSFLGFSSLLGLQFNAHTMKVILPVGISFYTFQTMSYTIDLFRKEIKAERSLLRFAVFVSFFPQLVAGPIVRAKEFLPQLQNDRSVDWGDLQDGINAILWGLVLKIVLADNLAVTVDTAFSNPESSSGIFLLVGIIFYAFQIYGDFAGYSLVAIGLARMLGYRFSINFDRPYFATSFSDFWKRWHISLSSWLRDYLYIPLGGNRLGKRRTHYNLMLTMLLGGLWHGAAWTFVIWGGLHGLYLILQRVCMEKLNVFRSGYHVKFICWLVVFVSVLVAWTFFRAQSAAEALEILGRIMSLDGFDPGSIQRKFFFIKGAAIILLIFSLEALSFRIRPKDLALKMPTLNYVFAVLCLLSIALFGMFSETAFIYFQF